MDEKNIREIARGHGWSEDDFLKEVDRLQKGYAYTEEGALAQAQKHFARKLGVNSKESRLRKIARNQGFDEGVFLKEYGRLIAEGRSDMDALSLAMKLFEKDAKAEKRPTLATFAPGHLDEPSSTAGLGAPPGERPTPPKPKTGKSGIVVGPKGPPRTVEEVGNDDAGPRIDSELSSWLVGRGFVRGPEGVAYTKTDKVGEDIVKLQIDFSDDARGMRYGYRLNISVDPPKWKPDKALRDHPTLLRFKRYRDDLLTQRHHRLLLERSKTAPPPAPPKATAETPAGGGTNLALLPPEVEEAKEMEHRDEQMIIRELKGDLKVLERALADYFYSFELRGRKVIGLSYAGVKAIIRRMGRIVILEIKVEEKQKSWFVLVKARDKLKDLEAYGAAIQPKQFQGGGENPFALTVAVSKAQRNAWRHFIDEKVVTETYRAWLEEQKKESGK
ncbi:hypothetical protein ES703_09845 [subsurface metagenome]